MKPLLHTIARALFHAGGFGLLLLGAFDSSPVVVPFGNDLLVLALCARYHERVVYYVLMATAGSLIGVFVTDWLSRKGEKSLKKVMPGKHWAYVRKLVEERAGWTLVAASVLPPPFPFTAIVAGAAALGYPRKKLLSVVAVGRLLRFSIEAALAVHYGRWIVRQARSPLLEHIMVALIVISILGTALAVVRWKMNGAKVPA